MSKIANFQDEFVSKDDLEFVNEKITSNSNDINCIERSCKNIIDHTTSNRNKIAIIEEKLNTSDDLKVSKNEFMNETTRIQNHVNTKIENLNLDLNDLITKHKRLDDKVDTNYNELFSKIESDVDRSKSFILAKFAAVEHKVENFDTIQSSIESKLNLISNNLHI